jgi:hypothetical protein
VVSSFDAKEPPLATRPSPGAAPQYFYAPFVYPCPQIFRAEEALRQRRKADAANPQLVQGIEQPVRLNPSVEHGIGRLMDQQLNSFGRKQLVHDPRARGAMGRNPDVERLALPHHLREGAHGLLHRRIRPGPVSVENVHVIQPHPL